MKKYIVPLSVLSFLLLGQMSFASSVAGLTACFDQGYETGVKYYNTGDKRYMSTRNQPCCKNPDLCRSYQAGIGYVIQYGPQKTYKYDEIRHTFRMLELMH